LRGGVHLNVGVYQTHLSLGLQAGYLKFILSALVLNLNNISQCQRTQRLQSRMQYPLDSWQHPLAPDRVIGGLRGPLGAEDIGGKVGATGLEADRRPLLQPNVLDLNPRVVATLGWGLWFRLQGENGLSEESILRPEGGRVLGVGVSDSGFWVEGHLFVAGYPPPSETGIRGKRYWVSGSTECSLRCEISQGLDLSLKGRRLGL